MCVIGSKAKSQARSDSDRAPASRIARCSHRAFGRCRLRTNNFKNARGYLLRAAGAVYLEVARRLVYRPALAQNVGQFRLGGISGQARSRCWRRMVRLHAPCELLSIYGQPDETPHPLKLFKILAPKHRPAASRNNVWRFRRKRRDHVGLNLPKRILAALRENLGDRHSRPRDDQRIRIDEIPRQPTRQLRSYGRFTRAAHADQHDAGTARRPQG